MLTGHLYGRVRVCHVSMLLEKHLRGEIIPEIYRGAQFEIKQTDF